MSTIRIAKAYAEEEKIRGTRGRRELVGATGTKCGFVAPSNKTDGEIVEPPNRTNLYSRLVGATGIKGGKICRWDMIESGSPSARGWTHCSAR
jgi:hypothetical protein